MTDAIPDRDALPPADDRQVRALTVVVDPAAEAMKERRQLAAREIRHELRNRCPPFNADEAALVVEALASGRRVTAIGSDAMFPAYWVIYQWRKEVPEFDEACVEASKAFADDAVASIVEISDNVDEHPASRAVRIDARLKAAKLLHRVKYGDKVTHEVAAVSADDMSDAELTRLARQGGSE